LLRVSSTETSHGKNIHLQKRSKSCNEGACGLKALISMYPTEGTKPEHTDHRLHFLYGFLATL
jgi:hypothetical protein